MRKINLKPAVLETNNKRVTEPVGRYFVHLRSADGPYPLVYCAEPNDGKSYLLNRPEAIGQNIAPLRYKFARPVPRNPVLADHHKEPDPVVSTKVKDALEHMVAASVEFVPAQIEAFGQCFAYWVAHSMKTHDVIDRNTSEYDTTRVGAISWIDKLCLDWPKLAQIDKRERMLFQLNGSAVVWLWHEEAVRAVQATDATGIQFLPAEGYGQDAVFSS